MTERSVGEASPENGPILDSDRNLVLAVAGVEVGRVVIVVEHADHDSKKPADLRHVATVPHRNAGLGPEDGRSGVLLARSASSLIGSLPPPTQES
jgi:hypothetical protein